MRLPPAAFLAAGIDSTLIVSVVTLSPPIGTVEWRVCARRRQRVSAGSRGELSVERVPSAEKRKYSQYKCSVGEQPPFSVLCCLLIDCMNTNGSAFLINPVRHSDLIGME